MSRTGIERHGFLTRSDQLWFGRLFHEDLREVSRDDETTSLFRRRRSDVIVYVPNLGGAKHIADAESELAGQVREAELRVQPAGIGGIGTRRVILGQPDFPEVIDARVVQPEDWIARSRHGVTQQTADSAVDHVVRCTFELPRLTPSELSRVGDASRSEAEANGVVDLEPLGFHRHSHVPSPAPHPLTPWCQWRHGVTCVPRSRMGIGSKRSCAASGDGVSRPLRGLGRERGFALKGTVAAPVAARPGGGVAHPPRPRSRGAWVLRFARVLPREDARPREDRRRPGGRPARRR
jgi:hypothetical protein